ncbi:MAG: hypothetical protein ACI9ES_002798, partial [Oceanospirillaceae bacterium]
EKIVGFLYLGTAKKFRPVSVVNSKDFVSQANITV